jgi:hypothetical protein
MFDIQKQDYLYYKYPKKSLRKYRQHNGQKKKNEEQFSKHTHKTKNRITRNYLSLCISSKVRDTITTFIVSLLSTSLK